jgi:hypothetical protein
MAHDHSHDENYRLDQTCTVIASALIGLVTILLYRAGLLNLMLNPKFHLPVLWGGIALLVLSAVRVIPLVASMVRRNAKPAAAKHHHHDHDHNHADCGHDHDHSHAGDHTHGHGDTHDGHDHAWAPWRYVILLLPVVLFFLDLPNQGFASIGQGKEVDLADGTAAAVKDGDVITGFLELERASATENQRSDYAGRRAKVVGQVAPSAAKNRFSLVRYKISCCAADAVPLNMVAEVSEATDAGKAFNSSNHREKWVEVTGVIQFRKVRRSENYITVLEIKPEEFKVLPSRPANPFVY